MTESIKDIIEWWDSKPYVIIPTDAVDAVEPYFNRLNKTVPALKTCIEALEKISKDNPQSFHEDLEIAQEALKSIGYLKE